MPADCTQETAQASETSHPGPAARPGVRLYQAATLLVILLFLLSFWSC
jgi:hypothetical protein